MKPIALFLFALPVAASVYLRSGSPPVSITNATNTNPIVITAAGHGFSSGDVVFIYYVLGNTNANGLRKVRNPTSDTFEITDLDGRNVAGNGTFSGAANPIVGKASEFEPGAHPRLIFSKPEVLARIQDPDGSGSQKAPCVQYGSPCNSGDRSGCTLWDALENRLSGKTTAGCDGLTPALCAAENSWSSVVTLLAATGWYADQSRTDWLNGVKYTLRHMPEIGGQGRGRFTACDESSYNCGTGSDNDWASEAIAIYSMAYTLVRDALTADERQYIANRIFNDVSDGCTNMLQKQSGTASITSGSAVVTGSGLSAYAPGDGILFAMVYPTSAAKGLWAKVASVQSDSQLTLTASVSVTATEKDHYKVMPWTSSTCGINWYVSHHGYAPAVLARKGGHAITEAMDASQTYFTVAEISNYLDPPPFLVKIDSEYMVVTEISGTGPYTLTVTRGALYRTPAAHSSGRVAMWERYAQWNYGGTGDSFYVGPLSHNLVVQKLYGYLFSGAAFHGDDSRAASVTEAAWNYWYDLTIRAAKRRWTGVTGSASSSNYHLRRWLSYTFPAVFWAKYGLAPSLDISGGDWLKAAAYYLPYAQYPHAIRYTPSFADSGGETMIENDDVAYLAIMLELYAGTDEAAYTNHWLRNRATSTPPGFLHFNMAATAWGDKTLPYFLAFTDSGQASTDYTGMLDPWRFFTAVDDSPSEPYGILVSRTGWNSSDDTHLLAIATRIPHDHWHPQSGPGNYKIAKKTKLLDDNGAGGQSGGSNTNYVEIGGTTNLANLRTTSFDRERGTNEFVYARVNNSGAYTATAAVTSAYRHLWHLKGAQDYVVAYDVVNTAAANQKKLRLHYYRGDLTSGHSLTRTGGEVVFTKGATARLSSKILLPTESEKISHTETPSAYAYTVTVDDGSTVQSEFLVVHRPSGDPADGMPPVRLLAPVQDGFRGVDIQDASQRWIVVMGREDRSGSVSFEPEGIGGTASIVVAGLEPGIYSVSRNGQTMLSGQEVGADGTLSFSSEAGAFSVFKSGVLPLAITTTELPQANENSPYSVTLMAQGGAPPYSWAIIAGSLPPGLSLNTSSGKISGTPLAAGAFPITVQVVDSTQSTTTKALALTVEPVQQGISILPDRLPDAVAGEPYEQQLSASQGMPPYVWSLASGTLPEGLTLSAEGRISGIPTREEARSFVVRVQDSGTPPLTGSRTFEVGVYSPLKITTGALPDATAGQPYSAQLEASGGLPAYLWSLAAGALPPGLSLDETGRLSGTPGISGVARVRLQVADSAQPPAASAKELNLRIQTAAGSLGVQPAQWDSQRVQARYGRAGLDANQPCTLVLSTDAQFSNVAETVTDGGGAGTREHIFGLAASLDPQGTYYLRATCGAEQAQAMAVTAPEPPERLRRFRMSFRAPAIPGVSDVLIEYGSGATLDQSLVVPCTDACRAELLLPAGQLVRLRRTFRNAAGMPLAAGSPVAALAP